MVYTQNAVTGAVTIPTDPNEAYRCGGDPIYPDSDVTGGNRLPRTNWHVPTDPAYNNSWLNFGGGVDYNNISWDMPTIVWVPLFLLGR
jgi:hypothetical protein